MLYELLIPSHFRRAHEGRVQGDHDRRFGFQCLDQAAHNLRLWFEELLAQQRNVRPVCRSLNWMRRKGPFVLDLDKVHPSEPKELRMFRNCRGALVARRVEVAEEGGWNVRLLRLSILEAADHFKEKIPTIHNLLLTG